MVRITTLAAAVLAVLAFTAPVRASDVGQADAATVGSTEPPHARCPMAGKCPYYEHSKEAGTAKSTDGSEGCPLRKGGCPYYDQHKQDKGIVGALTTENDDCPLAHKCKFYQDVKEGKVDQVDFSKSNCPLAEKCPYYEEIKKSGAKGAADCPVIHACPHFSKKDIETQPHKGGHAHGHSHEGKKCPYLAKQKADNAQVKNDDSVGHDEL